MASKILHNEQLNEDVYNKDAVDELIGGISSEPGERGPRGFSIVGMTLDNDRSAMGTFGDLSYEIEIEGEVKAVAVGQQSAVIIAGNTGSVSFTVTTANIDGGIYTPSFSPALPSGVSAGNVVIANNAGTLTLTINNTATASSATRRLTLDGAQSAQFTFTITAPTITINTHPQSANVTAGSINGSVSVAASSNSASPLSYQWYSNSINSNNGGTPAANGNAASFTIPQNLSAGTYYYYAEVSGSKGETAKFSNVAVITVAAGGQVDNRMYDPVDNRYYDVIESGGLYWTVENFARSSAGVFYNNAGNEPISGAGKLYTYAEALSNAPAGWRLPSQAEYAALLTAFDNMAALKSTTEWATANLGTNTSGFNMPPAGYHNASGAAYLRERASFWTSNATNSRVFILANSTAFQNSTDANYLISVRYVKEAV
jgi:uncharacterized protein (TIGR02145 family)